MRMVHALHENAAEGAQQVKQTGVGGDAKIVYALLTGMVSDKVVYPVRETATNAWEVSPPGKPAEITLPSKFNLQFTIRDFGPGLSHRFMMDRYAKIGESTKDDDDQAVGGWGFGSKSPLAYLMRSDGAGSFTVISRFRGFRRVYSIGVGTTGKIEISFLGEWPLEPEDRGTGLEVTFPVRPDDITRFHDHAKAVYWSFEPRPKITPAIDFGKPEILHSGNGWTVYRGGTSFMPGTVPFSGPQVKLGPVMYPIDPDLMPATDMLDENTCIVFDAKIGSISVSASREALQYDDRTEAGLKALFDHYREDWMAAAKQAIDAEPDYFKARWKASDISRTLPGSGWGIVRGLGWRGYRFSDTVFANGWRAKATLWPEARGRNHDPSQPVPFRMRTDINPGEMATRKVVIQHNSSRSLERIEAAGLLDTPFLWVRCKRADKDWALEQMGNPEHIVLDDIKLPKLTRGPREKRPESVKRRKVVGLLTLDTWSDFVDHDEELLYLRITGRGRKLKHIITVDGQEREFGTRYSNELRAVLANMRDNGLAGKIGADMTCVVVGEDEAPEEHWISLGDHLVELLDEAIDPTQVAPTIPWDVNSFPPLLRSIRDRKVDLGMAPQELRDLVYGMTAMLQTRKELDRDDNDHDRLAAVLLQLTGTDLKSVAKDPTLPIRQRWADFVKQYPLLDVLMKAEEHVISRYSSTTALTKRGQQAVDHYFQLLAK